MWLYDFIKDGSLADNQTYSAKNGELHNHRLKSPITLNVREGRAHKNACNNLDTLWSFLTTVSLDIKENLKQNTADAIILFNDDEYEHNTDDSLIEISGTDANNFTLSTGNLIGFVKREEYSLKISSRFGDNFLRYIISDADGFLEMKEIGGTSDSDGYEWLLAYLWNIKLKRAFRLGLPKAYRTKHERISCVKGTIDPVDYFLNETSGKYLCTYREHSYDSPATSLFLKAYDAIKHHPFCQGTRSIYNAFLTANQGTKWSRREILDTPHFTNPFYGDYNTLIDLSKKILQQQSTDFGAMKDSSAFFFDISMLFEYFIRKLVKRAGMTLQGKNDNCYQIPCGKRGGTRKLIPDLVFDHNGGLHVFDVKYKSFDTRYGVDRTDLFQLHTYIGQYGNHAPIHGCGFIYPISTEKWDTLNLTATHGVLSDVIQQQGRTIPFHILFLKVPTHNADNFNELMCDQSDAFTQAIQSVILPKK